MRRVEVCGLHESIHTCMCVWLHILCRHICVYVHMYVCVCVCVCVHRGGLTAGLKPLRAVYTNTLTKDISCHQTGREIYLPDSLQRLGLFERKQATDSCRSRTQNCCHMVALNPQLVSPIVTLSLQLFVGNKDVVEMCSRGEGSDDFVHHLLSHTCSQSSF